MTLDELLAALRAASSGSASLDNQIADYLVVARGTQYTRRLQDLRAAIGNRAFFGDDLATIAWLESGELCTTFGTPPDFSDHSHGKHPSHPLLAAVTAFLKNREGRA